MGNPFKYDVFISHSSKDKPIVRPLATRLKEDGLSVWFDEWKIEPGDLIGLKIAEGLEKSRTLVLAMSVNSFAAEWVMVELYAAISRDPTNAQRRFIPLLLDDIEIKDILRQYLYVDWRQKSEAEYARLLGACRPMGATAKPSYPLNTYRGPDAGVHYPPEPPDSDDDADVRNAKRILVDYYQPKHTITEFILESLYLSGHITEYTPSNDKQENWRIFITQATREELRKAVELLSYYFYEKYLVDDLMRLIKPLKGGPRK
ncbi:MAG TPA: toll/interleukin-1 receptor domain-containing protein [Blastocatellia bacterium]|nr:toll/interleukin-1 receptor domain-containing protein [Blastocatellia bacterium]